jgi:hypothetical protein
VFKALAIGAILMIVGGVVELFFGVATERRGLEEIAKPLTAVEGTPRRAAGRTGRAVSRGHHQVRPDPVRRGSS